MLKYNGNLGVVAMDPVALAGAVRFGAAATAGLRTTGDATYAAAANPVTATVAVRLAVNGRDLDPPPEVHLRGPGDVTAVGRAQVIRTVPVDCTLTFEPNLLAAVEFDRPDLPWAYTPAAATADGRLRPRL